MNTRRLAVMSLVKILDKSVKPREAMEEFLPKLERRDRAFLLELVNGVLRHRDYLDWMLRDFLKKPGGLSPYTINNLRLAVYQIRFNRVPERAVVHEAVDIEKIQGGRAPLVNAVLRGFLRREGEIKPPSDKDPVKYISITTSHPAWLVKMWVERFGREEALLLAEADNVIPNLALRIKDGEDRAGVISVLAEKGIKAHAAQYSPVGIVIEGHCSFEELSKALRGRPVIQDEAAQLVSFLLDPKPGERVLDACAAPGGKTTHLAELMKDKGEVVAVEAEEKRLRRLKENVSGLGLKSVSIVQADVRDLEKTGCAPFDRILLDAPCSSLGVIRRNPDVKYRHTENALKQFGGRQLELLSSVSRLLRTGGSIVYSVCSTEPEEGEEVIRAFLHNNNDFSMIEGVFDFLGPFAVRDGNGIYYRTFPHRHRMDGFFAVKMRRDG